jgi:hypothetical protein
MLIQLICLQSLFLRIGDKFPPTAGYKLSGMNRPAAKSVIFGEYKTGAFFTPPRREIEDRPRLFD